MKKSYINDECPYFRKVTFQKMELLNINTPREWDLFDQPDELEPSELINTEERIPSEGTTNQVKIYTYHAAGQFDSRSHNFLQPKSLSTGQDDLKENEDHEIIQIKMPKIFKSRGLCEKLNNRNIKNEYQQKESKNNLQRRQKPIPIEEIPSEQENDSLQFDEEGTINEVYMNESTPKDPKVDKDNKYSGKLVPSYSGFVRLFLEKQKKQCFLLLNHENLKIYSRHPKNTDLIHIEYFINLIKHKILVSEDEKNEKIIIMKVNCKNFIEEILVEFTEINSKIIFMSIFQKNFSEKKKMKRDISLEEEFTSSLSSLQSLDSYQLAVERVSLEAIEGKLENFDIVLFKGKGIMSKMQRFFTNSNFDHVALILKTYDGEILLLEATGNAGVAIYSFSSVSKAFEKSLYERVAIRKLVGFSDSKYIGQKNRCVRNLQKFVRGVNGKQYKFDPRYLIWPKSKSAITSNSQNQQTYFCSELVAEALKFCGIMKINPQKPSCSFLPKHFGEVEGLNTQLNEGFFYSQLILIE